MASNSLHLTTMCLKYRPTVVAAFCIYIACKWSRWEIPDSSEGKAWYSYVDENVTPDILKKLTDEYLQILERSPSKFKSKMKAITSNGQTGINQSPSVHSRDDGPSTSGHHKNTHDKHHHHHHNRSSASTSSGNANRKQPGDLTTSSSSSKQPQQIPTQVAGAGYKNQSLTQTGMSSSSSHLARQRPSSSGSQQPPYPGSSSETTQKPVNEDRTQHRQLHPENNPSFNMMPRPIDPQRQRMSSAQGMANPSSLSSQQQPQPPAQHPQPHQKPTNHEQRHSQPQSSKPQVDFHQKNMKHPQIATSGADYPNRSGSSSSSTSYPQSQQHKKAPWPQQQPPQPHQSNLPKPPQTQLPSTHSQPSLNSSSSSSNRNSSQSLPSYNESTKSTQPPATASQNDYWFNDKVLETSRKTISPIRPVKSMFSPSPEHDAFDRTKMMMMQASAKRNDSPKSEKQDRRSSTPSKREKRAEMSTTPTSQKTSQVDRKPTIPKVENTVMPQLIHDSGNQMKKRPFSSVEDTVSADLNRESKSRKLEPIKSEPTMKQPIETNPDIVKSLLQECYTSNKYDSFGMDSPLDVINPEPTNPPQIIKQELNESLVPKQEARDNGYDEDHHRKNKSKKKKDKHRHKKKKSHKSDREDLEDRKDSPLKIILSKDKSDSKSSPESAHMGGLKIKIPIKMSDLSSSQSAAMGLPPAPLKLKISKEKMGQAMSDGSSSSSSHKKKDKDKDRSKSKSSKHGNNNNNSDFKDAGDQHQQLPVNKAMEVNSKTMSFSCRS